MESFLSALFLMGMLWVSSVSGNPSKVLELSDRFVQLKHEHTWLIKFYAPWCGHCKKLEPIFKHVAQSLANEPELRVGRIDCTRFPSVATEFGIRGYPTILFLKGDNVFTYEGDRTRQGIVNFALRLLGPPVKSVDNEDELREAIIAKDATFVFIGEPQGPLWKMYEHTATTYQQHEFFYQATSKVCQKLTKVKEDNVIRVFKDESSYRFKALDNEPGVAPVSSSINPDDPPAAQLAPPPAATPDILSEQANATLFTWVSQERFPMFIKVTHGKFHHVLSTGKLVVLAVLEENKIGELTPEMEEFREMLYEIIKNNRDKYHEHFQFGWPGSPNLANNVAMETLALPNLLVVNPTTYQHHLPDDDPIQLTSEAIQIFLDDVLSGTAPVYGGSSYSVRLYRAYYEAKSSLSEMWQGNPALTAVLFGLPLGFFSLICYSICCADIMDAEEEDEDDADYHEKTE